MPSPILFAEKIGPAVLRAHSNQEWNDLVLIDSIVSLTVDRNVDRAVIRDRIKQRAYDVALQRMQDVMMLVAEQLRLEA